MKLTKGEVIEVLKTIKDPEIFIDIWTMGLIYDLKVEKDTIKITMTYTTPFCPWGPQLNQEIIETLKSKLSAKKVDIDLTFDPPYQMPADLRASLGI
jgi:metal-sulfur cluster biosynthetic enzyme